MKILFIFFLCSYFLLCCSADVSAQHINPITFIKLNDNIGFVIDSIENKQCNCIPYVNKKHFRYAALTLTPDSTLSLKIKLTNTTSIRGVYLDEKRYKSLYSAASTVNENISVFNQQKEFSILNDISDGSTYNTTSHIKRFLEDDFYVIQIEKIIDDSKKVYGEVFNFENLPEIDNKFEPVPSIERPLNNINFNFFGDASILSFNYERLYSIKEFMFLTAKIGVGFNMAFCVIYCSNVETFTTIPHHITINFGRGKNIFEMGMGGTMITEANQPYFLYPIIGYRFQPIREGRLSFRFFITIINPITFNDNAEFYLLSPVGISFGRTF